MSGAAVQRDDAAEGLDVVFEHGGDGCLLWER